MLKMIENVSCQYNLDRQLIPFSGSIIDCTEGESKNAIKEESSDSVIQDTKRGTDALFKWDKKVHLLQKLQQTFSTFPFS